MNRIYIIWLFFLGTMGSLQAQILQLKTAINAEGSVQSGRLGINKPGTWYKVYPDIEIPDSFTSPKFSHEIIDYAQVVYQSCRSINDNIWNDDRLTHMIDRWGVDTIGCSPNRINSFINGAIAYDQHSTTLHYAIDTDNDLSLTDEIFYPVTEPNRKPFKVTFERYVNSKITLDTATIKISKIELGAEQDITRINFEYLSYKKVSFQIADQVIDLTVLPGRYYTYGSDAIINLNSSDGYMSSATPGQYFKCGNKFLKIDRLDKTGKTIELLPLAGDTLLYSNQQGFQSPPIYLDSFDVLRNNPFEYTYLYIWNIDCAPCLQQLPKMQEAYDRIKSKGDVDFQVILVSVDKPERTRKFLSNKNIKFANIETFGNSPIYNRYEVHFFPSKYLIDDQGIILHTPNSRLEFQSFWALREK